MIWFMKCSNTVLTFVQFVFLLSVSLFLLGIRVAAQSPTDFQMYKDRYPSQPFVRLQDNADVEIIADKQGKPIFKIRETNKLLVLTDNCNEVSETRDYYSLRDEILKSEAYSLVPENGKYRKIMVPDPKKTTERDDNNYFDDSYCMVRHFPAITKGAVLYKYNEYLSHDTDFGYTFHFGETAPVESTGLTLTVPDNVQLVWRYAGKDTTLIKHTVTQKGNMTTHSWTCERLKGYYHDNLAPSARYYRPHLIVNIAGYDYKGKHTNVMGTLDDFCKWEYEKLKNTNVNLSPVVVQLADSITRYCTTRVDKVKAIYRWVQDNIKYVAIEDGDNGFIPQEATTVIARRYGDCKDKSSVITALLRSVGEKASLACVGTRSLPYSFTHYPMVASANHLIAIWWDTDNRPVPLDGTSRHLGIGHVPAFIQGKECLIVKGPNDCMVYRIPVNLPEQNIKADTLILKTDKTRLYGSGLAVLTGEEKSELMHYIESKNETQLKDAITGFLDFAGNKMEVSRFSFNGLDNPEMPLSLRYDISLPDYCIATGDRLYVNMNLHQLLANIDIKPDRTIPVESERNFTQRITTKVDIPDGYTLIGLPEKSEFMQPLFGYTISYEQQGGSVVQHTEIKLGFQVLDDKAMMDFGEMIKSLKKAYRKTVVFQKKTL